MPTLTVEVTDAQAARMQEAFKRIIHPDTGELPTLAEIRAWAIKQVRDRVVEYEYNKAKVLILTQASEQVEATLEAEGWSTM